MKKVKYFESLILWDKLFTYDVFDYFLNEDFSIERQKECRKRKEMSKDEVVNLLSIHKKMHDYLKLCENPFDEIKNSKKEVVEIKKLVNLFLERKEIAEEVSLYLEKKR